jgi:DNA-binding MarR family transcriptional regulator
MSRTQAPASAPDWEHALPHVLWRAQNAVHHHVSAALEDLGVTVTQLGLAVHLQELGALSGSDLSRGFRMAPQSVGTALTGLEKLGWVTRRKHPVHGRVVLFEITIKGAKGVSEGRRRMSAATAEVVAALPRSDDAGLIRSLRRIIDQLDGPVLPVKAMWPAGR